MAAHNWSSEQKNIFDEKTRLITEFMVKVGEEANGDDVKRTKLMLGEKQGGESGTRELEDLRSAILKIREGGKRKSLRKKRKSRHRKTRKY